MIKVRSTRKREGMQRAAAKIVTTILAVAMMLFVSGCGNTSGVGDAADAGKAMAIFCEGHADDYSDAANAYYAASATEVADAAKGDLGAIADDVRYVCAISADSSVLERERVGGPHFTINVFDDGANDIKAVIIYSLGTTENCVAQGKIEKGEIARIFNLEKEENGITDQSQRAKDIFDIIHEVLRSEGME